MTLLHEIIIFHQNIRLWEKQQFAVNKWEMNEIDNSHNLTLINVVVSAEDDGLFHNLPVTLLILSVMVLRKCYR